MTNIEIIHILNKEELGGAQSLTYSIIKHDKHHSNHVFYIAQNVFSKYLFKKTHLRFLPIIYFSAILIFKIFVRSVIFQKKSLYIFHLAESHLVYNIVRRFLFFRKNEDVFICMIHQSPQLYPIKLRKIIKNWENSIDGVVFYSAAVKKEWEKTNFKFTRNSSKKFVIHSAIPPDFFIASKAGSKSKFKSLQLVYVGRRTEWKQPEIAYFVANLIAKKHIKVTLNIFGLSSLLDLKIISEKKSSNLELKFFGSTKTTPKFFKNYDLMIYPVNQKLCIEPVGIAVIEALAIGLPVVVTNKNLSDFSNIDSIIDLEDFKYAVENYSKNKFVQYVRKLKKRRAFENSYIYNEFEISSYINKLDKVYELLYLFNISNNVT
jgi:glycosyltransferase involved in cell wall biosynthesis